MKSSFWICAGGTGGHISPAIALTESLLKTSDKVQITFISLNKNSFYPDIIDLQKNRNVSVCFYNAPRFPVNLKTGFFFLPKFFSSFFSLVKIYFKSKPSSLIAFGGYPVFPALVFALIFRLPFYLCEQNAMPGKVTRLFAKYSQKVFLSLPLKISLPNSVLTGNPIRQKIREQFFLQKKKKEFGQEQVSKKKSLKKILIVGGSQGAKDLNSLYVAMLQDEFFSSYQIEISCGKEMFETLNKLAQEKKGKTKIEDKVEIFISDMQRALQENDFIISRAGSGLLFEICAAAKPAILIPFPYAADNHQAANAEKLQELGRAKIIDIRPFNTQEALILLKEILSDRKFLNQVPKLYEQNTGLRLDAHQVIVEKVL